MFEDTNEVLPAPTKSDWDAVQVEREAPETVDPAAAKVDEAPVQAAAEATPAEAAPAAEVVDPYAGLSPEVKAKLERFDQLATEQPKLLQALKETQGRVSAMQSEFAKRQSTAAQPNEAVIAAAAKDPEKWAALKKDFPEWGEGIQAFVDARFEALGKTGMSPEQVEQLLSTKTGELSGVLAGRLEEMLIETKHENWRDVVKTPEFATWMGAQKPEVQALAASSKGRDALRMLDLFEEAKAKPVANVKQTRQQVLAAAVTGKPGQAQTATKTVEDMTPDELWKYEASLREKRTA